MILLMPCFHLHLSLVSVSKYMDDAPSAQCVEVHVQMMLLWMLT